MPDFAQWDKEVQTSRKYFGDAVNAYAWSAPDVLEALENRVVLLENQGVAVPASLAEAVEALQKEVKGFPEIQTRLTENLGMLLLSLQLMIGRAESEFMSRAVDATHHMASAGHVDGFQHPLVFDDELIEQLDQARIFFCIALLTATNVLDERPELIRKAFDVAAPDMPAAQATEKDKWTEVGVGGAIATVGVTAVFLGPAGVPVAIGAAVVGFGVATVIALTRADKTERIINQHQASIRFFPQTEEELKKWLPAIREQTAEVEKLIADCASAADAMVKAIAPPASDEDPVRRVADD